MIALVKDEFSADTVDAQEKPVARFLLLARRIHAKFTQEEERRNAARRAAEALAQRKNAAIMQAVQEVMEFCQILTRTPELKDAFGTHAKAVAERTLSNRYAYTLEDEPVSLRYEVPVFNVDMKASDGTTLSGTENAYLHIGFSPVRIAPSPEKPLDVPTLTTHTLFNKKYRIEIDGRITEDKHEADPIADILSEVRAHMGHDFFEEVLLPHLEAQASS